MSYSELAELQGLADHIDPGDVELLEAAGVPEYPDDEQTFRIEVRFDFTGTTAAAIAAAHQAATNVGGEVTAIFDADWNEITDTTGDTRDANDR